MASRAELKCDQRGIWFLFLYSAFTEVNEAKGKKQRGKIRRDRAPSGKNNSSPEFSTVHLTSASQ